MAIGQHVAKALAAKASTEKEAEMASDSQAPTETGMAAVLAQLAALQAETVKILAEFKSSGNTSQAGVLEKMLEQQEQLLVKTKPENTTAPMKSEYRPLGTAAYPDLKLKCKMTWVNYELDENVLRVDEIEWLNRLEPGEYRVTKADGTKIPFTVRAKHSQAFDEKTQRFALEQLDVWFPCKGEHRQNHLSMLSYCQQAVNGSIPGTDELLREVARLKAEIEAAKGGVLSAI
jgi:hypothetical protein